MPRRREPKPILMCASLCWSLTSVPYGRGSRALVRSPINSHCDPGESFTSASPAVKAGGRRSRSADEAWSSPEGDTPSGSRGSPRLLHSRVGSLPVHSGGIGSSRSIFCSCWIHRRGPQGCRSPVLFPPWRVSTELFLPEPEGAGRTGSATTTLPLHHLSGNAPFLYQLGGLSRGVQRLLFRALHQEGWVGYVPAPRDCLLWS